MLAYVGATLGPSGPTLEPSSLCCAKFADAAKNAVSPRPRRERHFEVILILVGVMLAFCWG